ncbi:MAG TPA: hypothetical protein DCX34_18470 [Roseovarius sp.]|nr:hypothetical protein [Roseovarius sp.]|tara:strand:+ start:300 stop:647 length:348 start_codon:yes stop_codon:yes gene_type:complete
MQQPDPITPDVLRLAKARVRPGHIAKELGVTRQRVYMRIGWLRRNGEDIPEFPRGPLHRTKTREPRLSRLPGDVKHRLAEIAEARGQSIGQFATRLLTVIARDDLVDAILDDQED